MKIIFAGSSEFGIPALEKLHVQRDFELLLAISQPARPKGGNSFWKILRCANPPITWGFPPSARKM
jgi:methionyl-tRNA formyltransferase